LLAVLADARAVGLREREHAVIGGSKTEPTLVHEPVMETTDRNEIAEPRLAATVPMEHCQFSHCAVFTRPWRGSTSPIRATGLRPP